MVKPNPMDPAQRITELTPYWEPVVSRVGRERTPILVVDDAVQCVASLRDVACQCGEFKSAMGAFYPGIRAPLPPSYVIDVVNRAVPLLRQLHGVPEHYQLRPAGFSFSLLTQSPERLQPLQRLPHFDTPDPYHFALLHYLNPGPHGSTALFRHRESGYERIDAKRMDGYFSLAQSALDELMKLPPAYMVESNHHYDCYYSVPYRENRLAIYPGNLLHSIQVNPEQDISDDPLSGRLTANLFIRFEPA
ncbi:DUF6445 family protein [Ferrimonas balearica]|uniref:DUF6445 family protein n=1 Tax=Ferrimonas balearica TaxID=44012 RepID=UPI0021BDE71E|nr:DUF6445 family protein [Ferrimonas balearica]